MSGQKDQENTTYDQVDKENFATPAADPQTSMLHHSKTMPKIPVKGMAVPLTSQGCLQPVKSLSEPTAAASKRTKALTDITNAKRPLDAEAAPPSLLVKFAKEAIIESSEKSQIPSKRPRLQETKLLPKAKAFKWPYSSDHEGVRRICSELGFLIEGFTDCKSPRELFEKLEGSGQSKKQFANLSPAVLKLFSNCPEIQTLDMSGSYAGRLNAVGLIDSPPFPVQGCTRPLYGGFAELLVLDLTNVQIGDDELRYLIKLAKLQALGLSGTGVTDKGLRYLSRHATFVGTLQCLKLCYAQKITDVGLSHLKGFPRLSEIDLLGIEGITVTGCVDMLSEPLTNCQLSKLRLPLPIKDRLDELHFAYQRQSQTVPFEQMDLEEIRSQLRVHRKHYPDVHVMLDSVQAKEKLRELIERRCKEEFLWSKM